MFLRAAGWTGGLATARVYRVRSSSKLDSPTRIALKENSSRSGHQPKRTSAFITSTIGSRLSTGTLQNGRSDAGPRASPLRQVRLQAHSAPTICFSLFVPMCGGLHGAGVNFADKEIGRASGRARVVQYV